MNAKVGRRLRFVDWPLLIIVATLFALYLAYTVSFVALTPYAGIVISTAEEGWRITDTIQPELAVDDILVQIGELTFEQFLDDRLQVPFAGKRPGDVVQDIVTLDGRRLELTMPPIGLGDRLSRLVNTLWFFPFWAAGTAILLFLRPRDRPWRLLVAFMYLTAMWSVLGAISSWQIAGSRLVTGALEWLMAPVLLDLHLSVPIPLSERWRRRFLSPLYVLAGSLALLEFFQIPPRGAPLPALVLAILASFGLLVYRAFQRSASTSDVIAVRLMLAGIGLAFGPGVMMVFLPELIGVTIPGTLALSVSFIALPILPISYIYAIYKRQLGRLEFRANRLISIYSFILIYPTIFLLVLLFGEQGIATSAGRTFYLLAVSIFFAVATPPLLSRFQRGLNRLAYGTQHDPDDILRVFARQIPSALRREVLARLLTQEILPTLLIRQSALSLNGTEGLETIYEQGLDDTGLEATPQQLEPLIRVSGQYRPPVAEVGDGTDWVRLAIALEARGENIGVWLFGRRDPDDFYPQNDIDLLQTLANQMAPVIENIRLYEALQQHADSLAAEVASRTAELRSEKDRTQAILDSAGEGIFFTDVEGTVLYINPTLAELSGYVADEMIGRPLEIWQAEGDSAEVYRQLWSAIYSGEEWSGELLLRRKDGTTYDVNLTIAPIASDTGEVSGYVGVQSDISQLKEVDRLKSNIISNVSHELKTPLTTIKTYLMLLRRGKIEKRDDYLQILNREADRLTNIIEDLLDLSALEAGKIPSEIERVDIPLLVSGVMDSCLSHAREKAIDLQATLPNQLPEALADGKQIEQVLTNLVVNAVNYTPGGGHVTVCAGSGLLADEPALWLRVTDTGPGISADELPHLFDRFYRGRAAQDSGAPGTGLGLAICREIIDRHHGKIEVESTPGTGASFVVWIPAV